MKIIAIEEHVLPDEVKQAWNTIPGADDGTLGLNPGIIGERLADLGEQRLALMDETGVDMQVLSLTTPASTTSGITASIWPAASTIFWQKRWPPTRPVFRRWQPCLPLTPMLQRTNCGAVSSS